jgi:hypothetical protein
MHFTVGLRDDDRENLPRNLWSLVAEVQLHRPGEALWAGVNHDLFYKSRISADPVIRRAMNRLSALLELVDLSMAEIRTQLLNAPGADVARIVDGVEKDFLRMRGMPFNEQLTVTFITALRPALGVGAHEGRRERRDPEAEGRSTEDPHRAR